MGWECEPTRREFVKGAGTTAGVAAATALSGAAFQKTEAVGDPVRYGIVGTGDRGTYLLRHMGGLKTCRCVAVCDTDEASRTKGMAAAGNNPRAYRDYRELLSRNDVEAVLVVTPLYTHFPITRDVLLAGKHVFCESPLVFKPQEIDALRALAAQRPDQVVQVGLERRSSAYYQAAKMMVAKGLIGDVTHIIAQWHRNPGWQMRPYVAREANWQLYREYSGGLAAELASHQMDVASWMFDSQPQFVVGIGGQEFVRDGRDIFDNIQLIYRYPLGQKFICTAISSNQHLPLFGETRAEVGERIMGTHGTIEITLGTDKEPGIALWYIEPKPSVAKVTAGRYEEGTIATATLGSFGYGRKGYPILLAKDQFRGDEPFLAREMEYFRRWLYGKGIMLPREDRYPVEVQMEGFFDYCRSRSRPKADLGVGLANSAAVILSNLAMDEERRVYFNEIDKMGRSKDPGGSAK